MGDIMMILYVPELEVGVHDHAVSNSLYIYTTLLMIT